MSLLKLRILIWGMIILGIVVPFIPPIYHRGLLDGIFYLMTDENTHTVARIILMYTLMSAPYLLIALLQYTVHSLPGTRYLLLLSIVIAIVQLITYFVIYNTFVLGLFLLAFPPLSLPAILIVLAVARKKDVVL